MESGPAAFAGTAFALFGAVLLLWTAIRVRAGAPVVESARPGVAALLAVAFGLAFLGTGGWLLAGV